LFDVWLVAAIGEPREDEDCFKTTLGPDLHISNAFGVWTGAFLSARIWGLPVAFPQCFGAIVGASVRLKISTGVSF
jgi:hypothetical protein